MPKGGGTSTNTVTQNNQPPAQFQSGLSQALTAAQNAAATPYQNYSGQLQAGFSPQQQQAFGLIGATPGLAAPYINSAAQHIDTSTAPIWPGVQQWSPQKIGQYYSPFQSAVVNTTEQQFQNQNAQAANRLQGNAASAGALGGDRAGVAQGVQAGQEALAQAPVIAGLENTGFGQAQQEFNQQQQAEIGATEANAWLNSQAGFGMANLGNESLGTTLQSANALLGAGGMQQQQAQQGLNIPYEQWLAQQSYPFQTAGWLSGVTEGLGSTAGGNATTVSPGPSPWSQLAGTAIGGAGLIGATGGFGSNGWLSGLGNGIGNILSGSAWDGMATGAGLAALSGDAAANIAGGAAGAGFGGALGLVKRGGRVDDAPRRAPGGLVPPPASVSSMVSPKTGFAVPQITVTTDNAGTPDVVDAYLAQQKAGAVTPPIGPQTFPGQLAAPGTAPAAPATPMVPATPPPFVANPFDTGGGEGGGKRGGVPRNFAEGGNTEGDTDDLGLAAPLGGSSEPDVSFLGGGAGLAMPPQPVGGRDTGEPLYQDRLSDIAANAKPSPWLALVDAGFSIAAGKSPHALTNIGAGAQRGVEQYTNHEQAAQALTARVEEARARLSEAQAWHEGTLATRNRGIDVRGDVANRMADLRTQGLSDLEAWRQIQGEIQSGRLAVANRNADTNANRAQTTADQGQQRIELGVQRLRNTQTYQQQQLALRQQGLTQQEINGILSNAARVSWQDPTKFPDAVKQQLEARKSLGQAQSQAAPPSYPAPPSEAVAALRADLTLKQQFDAKYGPGAADRILKIAQPQARGGRTFDSGGYVPNYNAEDPTGAAQAMGWTPPPGDFTSILNRMRPIDSNIDRKGQISPLPPNPMGYAMRGKRVLLPPQGTEPDTDLMITLPFGPRVPAPRNDRGT